MDHETVLKIVKNLDPEDAKYTARRDLDEHIIPENGDAERSLFKERREMVAVAVASMTRGLEQALRSMSRNRKQAFLQRGRIDQRRLTEIAKGISKEVFYKTRKGEKLDVAVEIIIDESGSMSNYLEVQLLALAIGEALTAIGIPFEITGTTTKGGFRTRIPPREGFTRTNPIAYRHYKTFGETWMSARSRIVHTGQRNNNIDGEAVEYCAFRLAQRKESRKVIFSLSDGEPCGGQGNDAQLAANLKRVCKKVRKAGTEVYGFGIGTNGPESLYGKEWFVYLKGSAEMGPAFVRKFADVVTGGRIRA